MSKITQADMSDTDLKDYNLAAYVHDAMKLSLPQRIRLCVAILEPDVTHDSSKLGRAVGLLQRLIKAPESL